jgi:hypothetical protein
MVLLGSLAHNKGAAPNAGGRQLLAIQTSLAARVGELYRSMELAALE